MATQLLGSRCDHPCTIPACPVVDSLTRRQPAVAGAGQVAHGLRRRRRGVELRHAGRRAAIVPAAPGDAQPAGPEGPRSPGRLPWATLLRCVFAIEVLACPWCAGPRRILGAVTEPLAARQLLATLGLAAEPPPHRSVTASWPRSIPASTRRRTGLPRGGRLSPTSPPARFGPCRAGLPRARVRPR
jgi:hypothetical protein